MQIPPIVQARELDLPASLSAQVQEQALGLERFYSPIIRCRVTLEGPGKHHHQGGPYEARIDLRVPGGDLLIERQRAEELQAAVHQAFNAARRKLEDYARRQRGDVKRHEPVPEGQVVKLVPENNYGFLLTIDGRELYFHRNSVLPPGFDELAVGSVVRFAEELGDEGPQASTVAIIERREIPEQSNKEDRL